MTQAERRMLLPGTLVWYSDKNRACRTARFIRKRNEDESIILPSCGERKLIRETDSLRLLYLKTEGHSPWGRRFEDLRVGQKVRVCRGIDNPFEGRIERVGTRRRMVGVRTTTKRLVKVWPDEITTILSGKVLKVKRSS